MIVFLKVIFMVSYIWKLRESWYHAFTSFLAEIIISIEYNEDMLLEKNDSTSIRDSQEISGNNFQKIIDAK